MWASNVQHGQSSKKAGARQSWEATDSAVLVTEKGHPEKEERQTLSETQAWNTLDNYDNYGDSSKTQGKPTHIYTFINNFWKHTNSVTLVLSGWQLRKIVIPQGAWVLWFKKSKWVWGGGSAVKNASCSSKGAKFSTQHPRQYNSRGLDTFWRHHTHKHIQQKIFFSK